MKSLFSDSAPVRIRVNPENDATPAMPAIKREVYQSPACISKAGAHLYVRFSRSNAAVCKATVPPSANLLQIDVRNSVDPAVVHGVAMLRAEGQVVAQLWAVFIIKSTLFITKATFFNRKSGLFNRKSGFLNRKSGFFH